MARIRLTDPAQSDLDEIFAYTVETWGETRANAYLARIGEAIRRAADNPKHGPLKAISNLAFRVVKAERHLVFYREESTGILVIRILHERRDVSRLLTTR